MFLPLDMLTFEINLDETLVCAFGVETVPDAHEWKNTPNNTNLCEGND